MKARVEFLPTEDGATETTVVDADFIELKNGWFIASKNELVVLAANEKYVKYCLLYEG